MKNPTLVKKSFFSSCTVYLKKAGCGPYLRAKPQNLGLKYTLPYYNENFDIQTVKLGSRVEAGQL